MAEDHTDCKRIRHVLRALGYTEVRPAGGEEWRPLEQVNGRYGTTDETSIHLPEPGRPHVELQDLESGEAVGWARKPDGQRSDGD
jgi:hypothetical protein